MRVAWAQRIVQLEQMGSRMRSSNQLVLIIWKSSERIFRGIDSGAEGGGRVSFETIDAWVLLTSSCPIITWSVKHA